jgi:hypothetical protein
MAEQPELARFRELFDTALRDYDTQTSSKGSKHPLNVQLRGVRSEVDIKNLLQDRVKAFDTMREKNRMLKAIEIAVSILPPLTRVASAIALLLVR